MNKIITLAIALFVLPSLSVPVYADDVESTTVTEETVKSPDKSISKEVTTETEDGESTYKRETTVEGDEDSTNRTTTTTTTVDD